MGHPVVAAAPATAAAGNGPPRREGERWPSTLGGLLLIASAVLPWLGDVYGSAFGFRVPLAVAWDLEAPESLLSVGVVLAVLGLLGMAMASVRWGWPLRQIAASLAVVLIAAVMVQTARFTFDVGGSWTSALNGMSIGPYAALAGALVLLLAPIPPPLRLRRREPEAAAAKTEDTTATVAPTVTLAPGEQAETTTEEPAAEPRTAEPGPEPITPEPERVGVTRADEGQTDSDAQGNSDDETNP